MKIPKDPFAERWKERDSRPLQPRSQQQQQTKEQSYNGSNNDGTKVPKDPFRSRETKRPNIETNRNDEYSRQQSTIDDRRTSPSSDSNGGGSNDGVKRPREPFTAKINNERQPRSPPPSLTERQSNSKPRATTTATARENKGGDNIGSNRSFGSNISFGSRSGEDLTFEEYSSYFNVP
jgi:hypothetical protein